MPIIGKIDRARGVYSSQLSRFREAAAAEAGDTSYEKELIRMLLDMIETKTEIEILERVNNHRANNP